MIGNYQLNFNKKVLLEFSEKSLHLSKYIQFRFSNSLLPRNSRIPQIFTKYSRKFALNTNKGISHF